MLRNDYKKADEVPVELDPDGAMSMTIARDWIYSDNKTLQREAVKLLDRLMKEFPTEPGVRPLLILALIEVNELARAGAILPTTGRSAKAGIGASSDEGSGGGTTEETLCRAGRIFRERAESVISKSPDDSGSKKLALELFRVGCQYYEQAFRVRSGHYPLINLAELYLIKAALESGTLRSKYIEKCFELATSLLEGRAKWPVDLEDDDIWHAATEAHANILLGHWDNAYALLKSAKSSRNWKPFHGTSIGKGLQRTISAFMLLNMPVDQRFENPEALLGADKKLAKSIVKRKAATTGKTKRSSAKSTKRKGKE